jgi:hypothetical protein
MVYSLNMALWPAEVRSRLATVAVVDAVRSGPEGEWVLHCSTGKGRTFKMTERMLEEATAMAPEGSLLYPDREDAFMLPMSGIEPGKSNRRQVLIINGMDGKTVTRIGDPTDWALPEGRFKNWMETCS